MISKVLDDLKNELEKSFDDNFTGLVLFGSYAKDTQTKNSDVDIIITINNLPKDSFERQEILCDILDDIENKYRVKINPVIKTDSETSLSYLIADIAQYAKIIVDKNKIFSKLFKETLKEYKKGSIKKITTNEGYRLYVKNVK